MSLPFSKAMLLMGLFCGMLLSGCSARYIRLQRLPELQNPRAYLLEALAESDALSRLSGILQMKIETPRAAVSTKNIFFFKKPALLRLETLGFLSHPAMVSLTDGETIGIYSIPDMRYYSGFAAPENILKIIGIRISVQDLLRTALGSPPLPPASDLSLDCRPERDAYHFTLRSGTEEHHVWIDSLRRKTVKYRHAASASLVTEITYDDFRPVDGYVTPCRITCRHAPSGTTLQLRYEGLSAAPIPEERFLFTLPPQAIALSLDDFPSAW